METANNLPAKTPRKVPSIKEIFADLDLEIQEEKSERNEFNLLLNTAPMDTWLKVHPTATFKKTNKDGSKEEMPMRYLPIQRVEWLLTRLFIDWYFEIKTCQVMLNSVVVTGTLWYKDFFSDTWLKQDGVGAAPIIVKKDKPLTAEFVYADSVQKAAPAAKSFAIKDAAECIGKIFGKDLNRADEVSYESLATTFEESLEQLEIRVSKALAFCQDEEFKSEIMNNLLNAEGLDLELKKAVYLEELKKLTNGK